nr:PDxFFG protein [Mycoplasmopsis canis]WQQ12482.1 PDxFFG protein [Mycoplasmopsis canis]
MKRKKLSLKTKVLLSLGLIALVSGSAIGSMFLFAKHSDEVNGTYSNLKPEDLRNDFSSIRDEQSNLKPEIAILDPSKKRIVGSINSTFDKFSFLNNPNSEYNFDEFFKKYFEIYQESFILEVKYGSFSFYNEYVMAVKPAQFIEFTKWFFNNVSWGPDLLTLESFRIVPGVEQNGNAITLGSHSTTHKESSEIKFFPDAFFGSMPIYSGASGSGNARDALSYSLFQDRTAKKNVDDFLSTIAISTSLKNARNNNSGSVFLSLINPHKLVGSEFLVLKNEPIQENEYFETIREKNRGKGTFVLPVNTSLEDFEKYLNENFEDKSESDLYLNIFKNSFKGSNSQRQFKKAKVVKASVDNNDGNPRLTVEFSFEDEPKNHAFSMFEGEVDPIWYSAFGAYKNILDSKIKNFLDFYDYKSYELAEDGTKKTLWAYKSKNGYKFYKSKTEALDLNKKEINFEKFTKLSKAEQDEILVDVQVESLNVENGVFTATFSKNITKSFDAKNMSENDFDKFAEFKFALGYKGSITPIALQAGPEDVSLVDENGAKITGLDSRKYQVFVETYDGLVDKVLRKFPHLRIKRNGPHIVKRINKDFVYEYSIEEGEYYGLNDTDRIGLPLLLSASIPGFNGLSTDFLKYVGAHEYGHHYTLDQSQALNDNGRAVVVGGLSTRGGLNESSYYSIDALKNYLDARTNLEVTRVNSLGKESDKGSFVKFTYIKKDGTKEVETKSDIWGNGDGLRNDIYKILDNPKRRFLQTFEGLKEAANLRNVHLGDLFIANSFDEESGTLNPFIRGVLESFSGKKDNYSFEKVNAKRLLSFIKDGSNLNLDSEALVFNSNSDNLFTINPVTFNKPKPGNGEVDDRQVVKINMRDRDGNPVIAVPLNQALTEEELKYIDEKIELIRQSFIEVIKRQVSESGWNTPNSTLGGKIQMGVSSILQTTNDKYFIDNLLYRNDASEIDPSQNNIVRTGGNTRKAFEYTAIKKESSLVDQIIDILNSGFASTPSETHTLNNYELSQTNNTLLFVNGTNNNYSKAESYSVPKTNHAGIPNSLTAKNQQILDNLRGAGIEVDASFQNSFHSAFWTDLTSILPVRGSRQDIVFLNDNNEVQSERLFSNSTTNKATLEANIKKIALSNINRGLDGTKPLYNAYPSGKFAEVKRGNNTLKYPALSKLEDFFEYTSVDYSKASLASKEFVDGKVVAKFNWDINYVKTKIDFDEFKEASKPFLDILEIQLAKILDNEQALANEIMERFIKSKHFIFVKDFNPAKNLVENMAIFSSEYGVAFDDKGFKEAFVFDKNLIPDEATRRFKFDVNDLQNELVDFVRRVFNENHGDKVQGIIDSLNTQDLYRLTGNLMWFDAHGTRDNTGFDIYVPGFSNGQPSSDVINYNLTRVEPLLNDKFTDYIYNIAETLTRDYVQTTYVPNWDDFEGLPSFISGVNEAQTGLDYVVDATELKFWNDRVNNQTHINTAVYQTIRAKRYDEYLPKSKQIFYDFYESKKLYENDYRRVNDALRNNGKLVDGKRVPFESGEKSKYEKLRSEYIRTITEETSLRNNKTGAIRSRIYGDLLGTQRRTMSSTETRNSSYFSNLITRNNGYFKDRFQKKEIGMELYNDDGTEKQDSNIRLKDFEGKQITSRPKAFFISQLLNYGVGTRNIAGIFRNKEKDAVAMYGYFSNELAKKIKFIKFTDTQTKEVSYLPINIEKTNNIFYLQKQGDVNSKVTVEDLGYTSWVSDFAIMGKYRDTLLKPKHSYIMEFVDSEKEFVEDFKLGSLESLAENGKTSSQAPIKVLNQLNTNDEKTGKTIISIDFQFNITG